jgi:glycosyltransferase involved in cell wall biosynthesis
MMQDTNGPLISIITPTFNSESFLRGNLGSIQNQSYKNIEHIIIDGGSTDQTLSIIHNVAPEAIVVSEPDRGIADAFNKGIQLATGVIIGIINSDDAYANVLHLVAQAYEDSDLDFILHGDIRFFNERKSYYKKPRPLPNLFFYIDLPYYHPTVFVPKRIYDDVGLFSFHYKIAMDYDFLLRAKLKGYQFKYLPVVVAHFRLGGKANLNAPDCHREVFRSQTSNGLNRCICALTFALKLAVNYLKRLFKKPFA